MRQQVDGKLCDRKIKPCHIGNREAGCSEHQANVSVSGDQADREGTRSSGSLEYDRGNGDRSECKQESAVGLITRRGSARKWSIAPSMAAIANMDIAIHAQSVNGLSLCLDKYSPRNETNDGGSEGAAHMIKNNLSSNSSGEARAVPRKT